MESYRWDLLVCPPYSGHWQEEVADEVAATMLSQESIFEWT